MLRRCEKGGMWSVVKLHVYFLCWCVISRASSWKVDIVYQLLLSY